VREILNGLSVRAWVAVIAVLFLLWVVGLFLLAATG
jgi:hypothetical protein